MTTGTRQPRPPSVVVRLDRMFDREPPYSLESEMSLLGGMILDPSVIPAVAQAVSDVDFWDPDHATIFRAIVDQWHQDRLANIVLVCDRIERAGGIQTPAKGGQRYLEKLANETPGPAGAEIYARLIRDKARLRGLIDAAGKVLHSAYDPGTRRTDDILTAALDQMVQVCRIEDPQRWTSLADAEVKVLDAMDRGVADLVATGVAPFDRVLDGFPRQGMATVFGYPASGKTTFALTVALARARGGGSVKPQPVRVYSYEQPDIRVAATLMAQAAGLPVHDYLNRGNRPSPGDRQRLEDVIRAHTGVDFQISPRSVDAPTIYNDVLAAHAKHGPGVVVVDYIQDLPPFGVYQEAVPRITESMRILATIARDLGWLVLTVSQLGKDAARENRRPTLADGLGSSAIEQRSDFIVYVWREHQREPRPTVRDQARAEMAVWDWSARQRKVEWGVIKSKYGPLGTVLGAFDAQIMRWRDGTEDERAVWAAGQ